MISLKQKGLFIFLLLQTLGAIGLVVSFHIWLWPLELLVSFTQPLVVLLLISLTISSVLVALQKNYKKNWPLLAAAALAWIAGLYILFYSLAAQKPIELSSSSEPNITFAAFNKLYTNRQHDRYIDYFKQQNVDIVALQEMKPGETEYAAERLGFEYIHVSRPFATSGGTAAALLSRYPFETVETVELATDHPVVRAVVETPKGGKIVTYSVHIPVPASNYLYSKRNAVMESLAEAIQQEELPVLVGGDFNTTVFSPALRKFTEATDSTLIPVTQNRWPACSWYGFGSPLCLRIDHIYASKDMRVTDLIVAPNLGSDHRALIAKIALDRLR